MVMFALQTWRRHVGRLSRKRLQRWDVRLREQPCQFQARRNVLATTTISLTYRQPTSWHVDHLYQVYIGWSDVTYLCSQCDRHFVGQHVVLCVVKWWRFVALFESNWISWFKKMSVLLLSYWESDVYWRPNNKHFAELAPQNGVRQWYEEITSLSPYVYGAAVINTMREFPATSRPMTF